MLYDRITCVCGRTKSLQSKICVWCGIKKEDCDYNEKERRLLKKCDKKGHSPLFGIFGFLGLVIGLPIYLVVAWPEYALFLITGNDEINILNFLCRYVFTDRNNDTFMIITPMIGIAIWVIIWALVYICGRKIYENKK